MADPTRPAPPATGRVRDAPLPPTRPRIRSASVTMWPVATLEYLELLARDAAPVEFEGPVLAARAAGADADTLAEIERAKALALQVRGVLENRRRRETELAALFETAGDLAALTDVDAVLEAIVHRSRQLLHSDVAYLSLNDEQAGDTYMRVTDGATSALFRAVRLPLGAGLGGLVAQTATPYATADYFADARFEHTFGIDDAVGDEGLTSIVGVPLLLGRRVIGVLYAANRTVRPFGRDAIALLVSFAAHAAIAIDNARLLTETQHALHDLRVAGELLQARTTSVERAADAHDRLADLVLRGGDVDDVAHQIRAVLGGEVLIVDPDGRVLASTAGDSPAPEQEPALLERVRATSRTGAAPGLCAAPVVAGADSLGVLVLRRAEPLDQADRRILERGALVTALLLLFRRNVAETEGRLRGELLADVLADAERDPDLLRERARLVGADLDAAHAVVVAEVVGDRTRAAQAATFLASRHRGLSAVHRGRLVLVLPGLAPREAATLVAEEVSRAVGHRLTAGAAGSDPGTTAIADAHAEATRCLDTLLALGRAGEVAEAADLGFVGLLLGERRDVGAYVRTVLGPVLDYDAERGTALVRTLQTYYAQGANLSRTGAALHVHTNTVTQRLERVTQLLGEGWNAPERQLEVQLALRLADLLRP
ncbi:GAF domain-containing protein [Georgenia yuyongxinii]|uniref:GAF domain-containing protein n=1 Tax=Georgenia yuyongxinii TaxID=2589797 RepID=A0A5B8C813_9MICO|nr:GAF domain-containing protein [Georgenia yuyongxinii]